MPDDLMRMRQELHDLTAAILRQDPPLDEYFKAIAEAKIKKLQRQIKTLEEKSAEA